MNPEQCRLTDPEIIKLLLDNGADGEVDRIDRLLANAATEKALRVMLLWLQEFEDMHSMEMAASELEAMLEVEHDAS